VRGAVRYLVQLIVQGRRGVRYAELSALPRLRPSRDLLALTRGTRVTITVRAMDGDGKLGPAGSAIYRATRR
jgi:hypothetical protein